MNETATYWDDRYRSGRGAGAGSVGEAGARKAAYVNDFITDRGVRSVVDWGCGPGNFLDLLNLDGVAYLGVDVSPAAIAKCVMQFGSTHAFLLDQPHAVVVPCAELALSLDVIYHLTDTSEYVRYMRSLFSSATKFVIAHATDVDTEPVAHMRHHEVTRDAPAGWRLTDKPDDPTEPGFYRWERQ